MDHRKVIIAVVVEAPVDVPADRVAHLVNRLLDAGWEAKDGWADECPDKEDLYRLSIEDPKVLTEYPE